MEQFEVVLVGLLGLVGLVGPVAGLAHWLLARSRPGVESRNGPCCGPPASVVWRYAIGTSVPAVVLVGVALLAAKRGRVGLSRGLAVVPFVVPTVFVGLVIGVAGLISRFPWL